MLKFSVSSELHQTAIMKFVTLALALLLAVGSQAFPLQADAAPPQVLDNIRLVVDVYMNMAKQCLIEEIEQNMDGENKNTLIQIVDSTFMNIKAAQMAVSPFTNTVASELTSATEEFREGVRADVVAMPLELGPKFKILKDILVKHLAEYNETFDPVLREYVGKHSAAIEDLKAMGEALRDQLEEKVIFNVNETKEAMIPIVENVRGKADGWLSKLKEMAMPYVNEYREQLQKTEMPSISPDLKEKFKQLYEETTEKFRNIVMEAYNNHNKA